MQAFKDTGQLLQVTLSSIGDGVIATDAHGKVTLLNPVAQALTGWTQAQALGRSLIEVFHIVNQQTRARIETPALRALNEGVIVGLANHTILIAKDGPERIIEERSVLIKSVTGEIEGTVLVFRDITERYRQEMLVSDSRAYAENILSTLRHAFLVLDKDMRVVSANRAFYNGFATKREETEGRRVYELGNGQWDIPKLRELLEEILPRNGHTVEDFEVEHEFETIGHRVVSLNARRINRAGNQSELILLGIEDITERRKSEEALRDSHSGFETLFDTSPVGMYLVDEQFRLQKMSAKTRAVFGEIKDLIGRDFSEVVHILWTPSVADEIVAQFRHTLATGEPYTQGEFSEVRHDRNAREYYDWELHRIALPDGQCGVVCYFLDISARVLAQQAVRDSEIRYRRLFETAKDGILILDAHSGKITDANAFMGSLVGQQAHEMLGKELHEIGLFGDTEASKRAFKELQENRYVRYEHLPVKNQHGGSVEVEVVANVYQEDHTLVAQCNVRDISQRVVLENKVKEQAEAIASESRRKDEFLAMLSHELRNPLAPIRSAVYLLKSQQGGSESIIQQQALSIIERQVVNLTKLVTDLLEVSRVLSGRIRLERQLIELNHVVRHAIETSRPLIEQRRHELVVNLCDGTPAGERVWIEADATRIEEVFVNLLNNAAKYTPNGGRIEVWCEQLPGASFAQFRIRDNGVGIDKELLRNGKLFDLFTQADRSLDRAQGGLGIGLSLAHRLVSLHDGSIAVKSPPEGSDVGSEFVVRLPLSHSAGQRDNAESASEPQKNATGLRVLIVDDNIDLVNMLASSLHEKEYIVRSAHNGLDGLELARQWRPDVVLMDIGLPGMNGYEMARHLRADKELSGMRLIAVTGYGRDVDKSLAKEAGFDAHLIKPVDFDELEKLLTVPGGVA